MYAKRIFVEEIIQTYILKRRHLDKRNIVLLFFLNTFQRKSTNLSS
jgi:hypothetical protein